MGEDFYCICSKCRKRFSYGDAVTKKRMLYNSEIAEKTCPFCGSKSFSRWQDIHYLSVMGTHHRSTGQ